MTRVASSCDVDVHLNVPVPMRDGVSLGATIYSPAHQDSRSAAILTISPYLADTYHELGLYFARNGFSFVAVDTRGRGSSQGVFEPHVNERRDGYDTVEWLSRQPFCDGSVVMRGASYCAAVEWVTAAEAPPALKTIVATASPYFGVDVPYRNNIFSTYTTRWLALASGRTPLTNLAGDHRFWAEAFARWRRSGAPFRDLDRALGSRSELFHSYLDHPEPDGFWDSLNPTSSDYARITFPVLTVTGIYDSDQPGAVAHYREHNAQIADADHYLVIGPWDHAGTSNPREEVGGLDIGPAGRIDIGKLHLDWYRWVLGQGSKPAFLARKVAYYVTGAETWRYADRLDDVSAGHRSFFLASRGQANSVFASGALRPDPCQGDPDQFTYDPRAEGPELDVECDASRFTITDQRLVFALEGRQLVYHSEPFGQDLEISGFFRLSAWIAIDRPDTDLFVTIFEIGLDGSSVRLAWDALRLRYREGLRNPQLIETTEPRLYSFERFTFASRLVRRGHRLRLVVAPVGRPLDTPFAQFNPNTGGIVADESLALAQPVTVRLHHDEGHPSLLHVPVAAASNIS
jgi:putative CocE/NonD family hydrolase